MLKQILKHLTIRTLQRYQPVVVGITGSVGKTGTKDAVFAVLQKKFFVSKSYDNINNEIGVPCAVLGITPAGTKERRATFVSRILFLRDLLKAIWFAYGAKKKQFPRILVLELGADKPDDIRYLAEMLKPQVAIVTAVGTVPVHVEYYSGPEAVAREKSQVLKYIGSKGVAILNADDPAVFAMRDNVRGSVKTFALRGTGDIWATDVSYYAMHNRIEGLSFKIHQGPHSFIPVRLPGCIGAHQVYAVLAAVAAGLHFGMNMVEIVDALEGFRPPKKRMMLLQGINHTTIIDDTYNASPLSMKAALEALRDFGSTLRHIDPDHKHRTIAVLGDMKELGEFSKREHKKISDLAFAGMDQVITVGESWPENKFKNSTEVSKKIQEIIHEGDVILIKGSRAMKMEIVIDALVEKP